MRQSYDSFFQEKQIGIGEEADSLVEYVVSDHKNAATTCSAVRLIS